jgi:hypothetical protein
VAGGIVLAPLALLTSGRRAGWSRFIPTLIAAAATATAYVLSPDKPEDHVMHATICWLAIAAASVTTLVVAAKAIASVANEV